MKIYMQTRRCVETCEHDVSRCKKVREDVRMMIYEAVWGGYKRYEATDVCEDEYVCEEMSSCTKLWWCAEMCESA